MRRPPVSVPKSLDRHVWIRIPGLQRHGKKFLGGVWVTGRFWQCWRCGTSAVSRRSPRRDGRHIDGVEGTIDPWLGDPVRGRISCFDEIARKVTCT